MCDWIYFWHCYFAKSFFPYSCCANEIARITLQLYAYRVRNREFGQIIFHKMDNYIYVTHLTSLSDAFCVLMFCVRVFKMLRNWLCEYPSNYNWFLLYDSMTLGAKFKYPHKNSKFWTNNVINLAESSVKKAVNEKNYKKCVIFWEALYLKKITYIPCHCMTWNVSPMTYKHNITHNTWQFLGYVICPNSLININEQLLTLSSITFLYHQHFNKIVSCKNVFKIGSCSLSLFKSVYIKLVSWIIFPCIYRSNIRYTEFKNVRSIFCVCGERDEEWRKEVEAHQYKCFTDFPFRSTSSVALILRFNIYLNRITPIPLLLLKMGRIRFFGIDIVTWSILLQLHLKVDDKIKIILSWRYNRHREYFMGFSFSFCIIQSK